MAADEGGPLYAAVCAAVPQLPGLLRLAPEAAAGWADIEAAIGSSDLEEVIAAEELGRGGLPMSHGQGTLVAALLARAGYAHMAQRVRPNFWEAMESLDGRNGALLLRLLAEGRWR
ncbi:hypothetical protein ACFOGJ_12560 [Marinibaculum pumilum]|uniref:Uncharacterized protein n=1 Tax=Marinibaculum pumilum TaxID=1766165 RepID=A0ABV7L0C4_9PROT